MEQIRGVNLPDGWLAFNLANGDTKLCRPRDRQSIHAAVDHSEWRKQIEDFEFREGSQWTTEQIAAMKAAERVTGVPVVRIRKPVSYTVSQGGAKPDDLPAGWMAFPLANGIRLVRSDRQSIAGSLDRRLWAKQILDFEHAEGERPSRVGGAASGERVVEAMAEIQEPVPVEVKPKLTFDLVREALEDIGAIPPGPATYLPVREPTYDGGPDHLAALARDRDAWSAQCAALVTDADKLRAAVADMSRAMERLECTIIDKDARIAELKTELAMFKASNVAPAVPETPKLAHDPFRFSERKEPWRRGPEGIG